MTFEASREETPVRMRRVSISVEIEIPETEFADLAEEALLTGRDLRQLIAARYATGRRGRIRTGATPMERRVNVSDYRHLFDQAPPGERPYRGSGRPPRWLLDRIQQEQQSGG
jgi:hypothetical protein